MKKIFTKPTIYSLVAVVVAICVGLGVGYWLPPTSSHVTAAYESGIAEGQSAAEEDYSHQLEEQRSAAEASLQSALTSQENKFSETLQSAERLASSQAYQEGKTAGAETVFDALQLKNPYTGEIIENVDDYNEYVSQYLEESSQIEEPYQQEEPVYEEPEPIENEVIVYWVPNGKSYHASEYCRTLSRSKTIISGTIDEAIASGHGDPCDVCY